MAKTIRFLSKAFGEHLEKMAVGLIPLFIEEINFNARYTPYSKAGFRAAYFHVYSTDTAVSLDILEDISVDKISEILNNAYISFFRSTDADFTKLRVSLQYSNNKMTHLIVDDLVFYKFHQKAIKWHLGL